MAAAVVAAVGVVAGEVGIAEEVVVGAGIVGVVGDLAEDLAAEAVGKQIVGVAGGAGWARSLLADSLRKDSVVEGVDCRVVAGTVAAAAVVVGTQPAAADTASASPSAAAAAAAELAEAPAESDSAAPPYPPSPAKATPEKSHN